MNSLLSLLRFHSQSKIVLKHLIGVFVTNLWLLPFVKSQPTTSKTYNESFKKFSWDLVAVIRCGTHCVIERKLSWPLFHVSLPFQVTPNTVSLSIPSYPIIFKEFWGYNALWLNLHWTVHWNWSRLWVEKSKGEVRWVVICDVTRPFDCVWIQQAYGSTFINPRQRLKTYN